MKKIIFGIEIVIIAFEVMLNIMQIRQGKRINEILEEMNND